jgi:hypothetical protein
MTDLRKLARGKECQIRVPIICNGNPETTVLAHYRMTGISGMGIKSPDLIGAWACSACHTYVDSNHDEFIQLAFLRGVLRTQYHLIQDKVVKW